MKKTKDQLIDELALLSGQLETEQSESKRVRKEFAKAFGWKESGMYSTNDYRTPSWEEIFIEVGKLLNDYMVKKQHIEIRHLQDEIFALKKELDEKNKNI